MAENSSQERHHPPEHQEVPFTSQFESSVAASSRKKKGSARPSVFMLESSRSRVGRRVRRARLYGGAFAAVALLAYVVALAASNSHQVRVDWVFGTSSVSLVWLVTLTAILGWLLGLLLAAAFRWRTRAPRA
jgi:uncharacterized integral membrane protein